MRVIRLITFILIVLTSLQIQARDQDWGFFQGVYKFEGNHILMGELLRRDTGQLFDQRFFDYFRFSYGQNINKNFTYFVGLGHVNFENRADEFRMHQFLIYKNKWPKFLLSLNRLALEERLFEQDSNLYLRLRIRNQIDPLPQFAWGVSTYNEIFLVPQGFEKFYTGVNENRFGVGPRYTTKNFDLYIYLVKAYLRNANGQKRYQTWGQLQIRGFF